MNEDGENHHSEYEVEAILNERHHAGKHQYLVKWKHFPSAYNTWEPVFQHPKLFFCAPCLLTGTAFKMLKSDIN